MPRLRGAFQRVSFAFQGFVASIAASCLRPPPQPFLGADSPVVAFPLHRALARKATETLPAGGAVILYFPTRRVASIAAFVPPALTGSN